MSGCILPLQVDKPAACFLMRPDLAGEVYGPRERLAAARLACITTDLSEVEVILASWGCPVMDAAGSVRAFVTDEMWERDIRVSSAYALNAISVAEYTLAAILLSLKHGWRLMREPGGSRSNIPGAFGATVGLVSLGAAGRAVSKMLKPHRVNVVAYDPFVI